MTDRVYARADLTGDLGDKLANAASQLDALGQALKDFGTHFSELTAKLGQLDPDGSIAKLTGVLNSPRLTAEIGVIEQRLTQFQTVMQGLTAASQQVAEDSLKVMTPMNEAITRAKTDIQEIARGMSQVQGGSKEEKKSPFIDRFGGALNTIQTRLGVIETTLKPAETMVSQSAALQSALIRFQINAGASKDDMDALRKVVETTRKDTQLLPLNEAAILEVIGERAGTRPADVAKLLPIFSNFADAQMLMNKSSSYEQSAKDLKALTREAGITDPTEIGAYADLLNRASLMVSEDTATFVQGVKASTPVMKTELGMSNQDILLANVMANWVGASGESGAKDLVDTLTGAISGANGGGASNKAAADALQKIGILDESGKPTVFDGGHLDIQALLRRLGDFQAKTLNDSRKAAADEREVAAKGPDGPAAAQKLAATQNPDADAAQRVAATFGLAFGRTNRLAGSLSNPEVLDQIRQALQHLGDFNVKDIQKRFNEDSVERQLATAKANADTALVEMGTQTLPAVNLSLKGFNTLLSGINTHLQTHPNLASELGYGLLGASVGATAYMGLTGLFGGASATLFPPAAAIPEAAAGPAMELLEPAFMEGPLAGLGPETVMPEVTAGLGLSGPLGWMMGALSLPILYRLSMTQQEKEDVDTANAQGLVGIDLKDWAQSMDPKFLGPETEEEKKRRTQPVPATPPTRLSAQPWPDFPISPDNTGQIAFTMPSDQRGPTMERAVALSNADTQRKHAPVSVQVQPGKVIINLDGRTIATAVMEFMSRQVGGPNTGPTNFNTAERLTPPGTQAGVFV